jgi:hypothetical protein
VSGRLRRTLAPALALAWIIISAAPGLPPTATAAEYRMRTRAEYEVQPDEGRVAVSVRVTFGNTTPNPDGQFSVFEVIDLALQPGATEVAARDSREELTVTETERDGYVQASVRPRRPVRYRDEVSFTLSYVLRDGAASGTRIRPSLVAFPVWSFGTRGEVTVSVPGTFEVSVAGDVLEARRGSEGWILESGDIRDPTRWVAQLVASGSGGFDVATRPVPLRSGTVDLQVRAWADDAAWGRRTLRLAADALPLFEDALGLPYPGVGPLVVEESVTGAADLPDEASADGTRILVGYDQPPFMLLHQLGHAWMTPDLVADRWIVEGMASWSAARAAEELGVEVPYEPRRRRAVLADDRFPLVSWGAGEATAAQDAYGYVASWAVMREIVAAVGEEAFRSAWARIAAGVDPYAPVAGEGGAPPAAARDPVGSRALLDHLEAVSDADLAALFERWVLDRDTAALLHERAEAREELARLLDAAAGWGAPDPVLTDLGAWRFAAARQRIDETHEWLSGRDRLVAAAEEAGLSLPQRLRDRYRTGGGSTEARTELEAEQAVVDAYRGALDRAVGERGLLERIGLAGGDDPDALLRSANAAFAEGDLRAAADAIEDAATRLEHARTEGLVRVVAALVVVVALVALAWTVLRRSRPRPLGDRPGSDYTAAP